MSVLPETGTVRTPPATPAAGDYPLVSVIIPDYNHGQYICDAIDSVLAQAYRRFEIIVVDDGSTDNSREVVAQYGNAVTYIYQQNQGLSAARNTGIAAANGEFIALLDADDMYEPDFLSTLVFALLANPEAAGIYCGYQFVDHQTSPLPGGEARSIPASRLYTSLLDGNFLVPESILVHKRCYTAAGPFDESLRACEDWDMWLRITSQHQIIGTNRVLTRHRILPGSMSTDPIRMLDNRLAVLNKHFGPESGDSATWSPQKRRAYGQAYLTSCIEYLQFGDQPKAYNCFEKMAQADPALLNQQATMYELGCGDQPKGQRGNLAELDLVKNARVLVGMLDQFFNETASPDIQRQKTFTYGNAYLTLSIIAYNKGDMPLCRQYLLKALRFGSAVQQFRKMAALFAKSLVRPWLK